MKITKANGVVEYQLLAQLKQRAGETDPKITEAVTTIINGVKEGGDEAVREYTVRFDGSVPKKIEFDKDEIHAFLDQVDPAFKDAVVKAQQNIYDFHQRQAQQSWMTTKESGVIMGQRIRGLKRVGIYVPGGTAACGNIVHSFFQLAVEFKAAGQFFVGFNAHDSKVTFSILRNENWFRIIMTKCRNFIVIIP